MKSSGTAVVTADDSLNAPALTKARCVYYKITKLKDHEASIGKKVKTLTSAFILCQAIILFPTKNSIVMMTDVMSTG